jgi:hypothetical protein
LCILPQNARSSRDSQDQPRASCYDSTGSTASGYPLTDEEIEAYQQAHVKIPEIGENGEYMLEDGKPLRQYALLSNAQLRAALRARGIPGIGNKEKMIIHTVYIHSFRDRI